ncbi:MAG: Ig domain-containing protein, partial [Proteobacteria bacterium]|nr:Ig domain-containing protein [Pseudomonadota bacterium]MCL2308596.1 Ig domain-containing protein [Pseudomonadota bacterium]
AHTATVEIEDAANGITISFDVSFTVTPAGAVFGISHDVPAGSHNFASAALGYGVQPPLTVVVTNTGNQATGLLNIMRGGAMPTAFILSAPTINNIVVGGSASFTVTPVPGLVVGVYTATFTISNANVPAVSFNVRFEVTAAGGGAPVITTRALSNGRVGVAYNAILVASNAPTNWAVVGALPPGLALNPNTGAVSGTPTTAGVFSFDVTANNALGASAVATLSITIAPAAGGLGAAESIPTLGYGALLLLIALLGMGIAFHPGIRNRRGAS